MKNIKAAAVAIAAGALVALRGNSEEDSLQVKIEQYRKEAATRRNMRIRNAGSGYLKSQHTPDQVDMLKFEAHVKRVVRRAKLKEQAARRDAGYHGAPFSLSAV
jgi:hypothetical protein